MPQADDLKLVRDTVQAAAVAGLNKPRIAELTGFSDRHVRYRFEAARILGFIDPAAGVTRRGRALLATQPQTKEERRVLRLAILSTNVVKLAAPDLLTQSELDVVDLARRLSRQASLSPSTAERRARVLRAWRRQLKG